MDRDYIASRLKEKISNSTLVEANLANAYACAWLVENQKDSLAIVQPVGSLTYRYCIEREKQSEEWKKFDIEMLKQQAAVFYKSTLYVRTNPLRATDSALCAGFINEPVAGYIRQWVTFEEMRERGIVIATKKTVAEL